MLGKPACLVAPDFLHPVIATAAVAVVFVEETVILVVILVVAFGEPELCERNDLGGLLGICFSVRPLNQPLGRTGLPVEAS